MYELDETGLKIYLDNDTLSPILPGPFCDIRLYRIDGSHKTIFTIDGWALSKIKAARIGKSIARAAGLDYRNEHARDAQGFGSTRIDSEGSLCVVPLRAPLSRFRASLTE
jgi:hypothetical protein